MLPTYRRFHSTETSVTIDEVAERSAVSGEWRRDVCCLPPQLNSCIRYRRPRVVATQPCAPVRYSRHCYSVILILPERQHIPRCFVAASRLLFTLCVQCLKVPFSDRCIYSSSCIQRTSWILSTLSCICIFAAATPVSTARLEEYIAEIIHWMSANRLKLIMDKTEWLLAGPK